MAESKPWFGPKRYGYGSGLPIRWQGWVAVAVYIIVVLCVAFSAYPLPLIIGATIVFMLIIRSKTEGGWRWRDGSEP